MGQVTFAESAVLDLEDVVSWYDAQSVGEVGVRLVGEVLETVEQLSAFPDSGRIVPEFGNPSLRELIHPPFRIVYRLEGDRVRVVRVWRTERLMVEPGGDDA